MDWEGGILLEGILLDLDVSDNIDGAAEGAEVFISNKELEL